MGGYWNSAHLVAMMGVDQAARWMGGYWNQMRAISLTHRDQAAC